MNAVQFDDLGTLFQIFLDHYLDLPKKGLVIRANQQLTNPILIESPFKIGLECSSS
jgi:hypothetical protein